jgi:SAM-dependent methyltransferase
VELAPFIVCPETLGPLEPADGGFWSPRAERLYPLDRGLIFMGYPERDAEMIATTMSEERETQGLGGEVAATNLTYLKQVAPQAVDFINTTAPFVSGEGGRAPRALELGCGNGWVSWLLAAAGFETWMCDFEANSLATGLNLQHPNLGEGRRFVTDARFAPVAGGSMDLVVFKEFVHHVADYGPLFKEANRVLRDGGTMALMDPVRSLWKTIHELRHPDPHEGHHIAWPDSYLRAIRAAGMEIELQTPRYMEGANRRRFPAWMRRRAEAAIDAEHPAGDWLSKLQLRLFGGAQLLVVARKVKELAPAPPPPMKAIEPATLIVGDEDLAAYSEFPTVLAAAAQRLDGLPSP